MLHAKYKALMREADAAGMVVTTSLFMPRAAGDDAITTQSRTMASLMQTVATRIGNTRAQERPREALNLLLETIGAQRGYLYTVQNETLVLAASTEPGPPPAELAALLKERLQREFEPQPDDEATQLQSAALSDSVAACVEIAGRSYEPLVLFDKSAALPAFGAIAAVHYGAGARYPVPFEVLEIVLSVLSDVSDRTVVLAGEPAQ